MYSKATYVKPFLSKFIRTLGIENVGTLNKPKLNVVYAILANNGIKPIDKNQYGVPLYQYRDLEGLNDRSIIAGFHKWKDDMLRKDIEISNRDENKVKNMPIKKGKQPDTQTQISFIDEKDDKLYESLFGRKVYFTEKQLQYINESISENSDDKYIENDYNEKWLKITGTDLSKELEKKIKAIPNKSQLGLLDLAKVCDDRDPRYIAIIDGGLNGPGEWKDYFQDMYKVIKMIPNSWVIDLNVDVLDDVWSLYVGFRTNTKNSLNEGADGYEPEDSDAFFDMSYELSENLFRAVIKKLEENYKEKNDNMIYTYLGIVNHLLQEPCLTYPVYYNNEDLKSKKPHGNPLGIDLIRICIKCYNYLLNDKENRQGWEDFDRYKDTLNDVYFTFKNSMKCLNQDANVNARFKYHINESFNYIEPEKVLLVKRFLDDTFVRGNIPYIGDDGYPKTKPIVGLKGTDGKVAKNMDAQHLFYLLQDKFKSIYGDKQKRDNFLKQVMIDWYNRKITREGLLSVNQY